jgi:hypothetical protein
MKQLTDQRLMWGSCRACGGAVHRLQRARHQQAGLVETGHPGLGDTVADLGQELVQAISGSLGRCGHLVLRDRVPNNSWCPRWPSRPQWPAEAIARSSADGDLVGQFQIQWTSRRLRSRAARGSAWRAGRGSRRRRCGHRAGPVAPRGTYRAAGPWRRGEPAAGSS